MKFTWKENHLYIGTMLIGCVLRKAYAKKGSLWSVRMYFIESPDKYIHGLPTKKLAKELLEHRFLDCMQNFINENGE